MVAVTMGAAMLLPALASATAPSSQCVMGSAAEWTNNWVIPFPNKFGNETDLVLSPANITGDGTFTLYIPTRGDSKPGGVFPGHTFPNNSFAVFVQMHNGPNVTKYGTFSADCQTIHWETNETTGPTWCAAWTKGCASPAPPYGQGFSFLSVFDSNMVLQSAPAKSAVYGIAVGPNPVVEVTVTGEGDSYTLQTVINATHQPFGDEYTDRVCPWCNTYPGPYITWKAFLKPTAVGGNYTIVAKCTSGCTPSGEYDVANITNVTFGDVWHCSGQSNMEEPVYHTFSRNYTIGNITQLGKYHNIRLQAGPNSGPDKSLNPWFTAYQGATELTNGEHMKGPVPKLFLFSAACWYFAQKLTDELEAAGKVVPIGLVDSAMGGQRIEEYMRNNTGMQVCKDKDDGGENWGTGHFSRPDGILFGLMVLPYVDMTTKGFLWYQGENNMGGIKGNSDALVGYSCEMIQLIKGWRETFSETPGTTDPMAPWGIITLASSGSEGGSNMGAMRLAQTAGYGVTPNPGLPNTFSAQAYDLDDPWGPDQGLCFDTWMCCGRNQNATICANYTKDDPTKCDLACAMSADTATMMGGLHPRCKKALGDRAGAAGFAQVYGGTNAATGPTLSSCAVTGNTLTINFNASLMRGDSLVVNTDFPPLLTPKGRGTHWSGGSQLYAQVSSELYCQEPLPVLNQSTGKPIQPTTLYCPEWAGGQGPTYKPGLPYDGNWTMLKFTKSSETSITVDLSPLNGSAPTAIQYAWGIIDCCDHTDPTLYVTHGCLATCPIYGSSGLPANPFHAKIVNGKCECIYPQVC
eukprot:m.28625 g.28625  ORF g.28625 m.28625 type:complete len:802 (+) comp4534_c0_seq1:76-2481(+)